MSPSDGSSRIVKFLGMVAVEILVLKIQSCDISLSLHPAHLCLRKLGRSISRVSVSISRSEELTRSVTSVDIRELRLTYGTRRNMYFGLRLTDDVYTES